MTQASGTGTVRPRPCKRGGSRSLWCELLVFPDVATMDSRHLLSSLLPPRPPPLLRLFKGRHRCTAAWSSGPGL